MRLLARKQQPLCDRNEQLRLKDFIASKMLPNEMHRFSIAPMMDWTDSPKKAKHYQNLSVVAVGHAVPMQYGRFSNNQPASNFGLTLQFGGCLAAQRIALILATDLCERMGRSIALGRSNAIQEHDRHPSIPRRMG